MATPEPLADDNAAVADLRAGVERQRSTFARDRAPGLEERRHRLEVLIGMMLAHRDAIADALAADFGTHPRPASDLIEALGVIGRAHYALERLEEWMRPEPRGADPALFGTARAFVAPQPKGVVGNIVPWNFPFDLSMGPLVEMLAAGNRVVIKPSEYTPACGALLARMVADAFDPALVHVVLGGHALAAAFADTAWDHLLYTGSPAVGRQVMAAAARHLTPVTLELGGKCPALLAPGAVTPDNVGNIIGAKLIKNGQMCVSVDHVHVHRNELELFVDLARRHMAEVAPGHTAGADCTGIISPRHVARIDEMLAEAADCQTRLVRLDRVDGLDPDERRRPLTLAIDPAPELAMMQEEVFGPILPVLPYDELGAAVERIAGGERPLGLYVFADEATAADVLARTHSGGATVNGCAMQSALPSLGFGGSGTSGFGRHHGIDGFREFSNPRGVVVRGTDDMVEAFFPPYARAAALVEAALA